MRSGNGVERYAVAGRIFLVLQAVALLAVVGCATPKGASRAEKLDYIGSMKKDTLAELQRQRPETGEELANAEGYAVFSGVGAGLLIGGSGNGYGVVVDNETGRETYMRMLRATAGLGVGIKKYRMVFVFHDREKLDRFIDKGWEFGPEADVALKAGEAGGAVTGASVLGGVHVYQFTEGGAMLRASLGGTKFWKDGALN